MIKKPSSNRISRRLTRKLGLIIVMTVACAVFAGGAIAQGVITNDPTAIGKLIAQYAKQIEQYKTQLDQYRAMLTKIKSLGNGVTLSTKTLDRLTQDQSDQLVAQACPGAPLGGIVGGLMSGLGSSSNQSLTERQQLICKSVVLLQVDEYNITADALGQLNVQASTVQTLNDIVNGISSLGEANSASSQAAQYMAQLQTASDTWKKQIEADDAMIQTLERQQGILAKVSLNGSNSVLGHVVNAVALKAAFSINE